MEIDIPGLLLINAEQGSGKSHLIRYLMYNNRYKFDYGIVFTNTYFETENYDFVPNKYIHPEYDEEVLHNLMKIQSKLIKRNHIKEAFVIFDDCIDKSQFNSTILKQACTQLRHYHLTIIFATQYTNILPTYMRANAMSVVIFKSDSECNLKALFSSYGQKFNTFNDFKTYIMTNLGNYKFIYYNKKHITPQFESTYRVLICPEKIPNFKIKFNKAIM